jgi:hypothetical protein
MLGKDQLRCPAGLAFFALGCPFSIDCEQAEEQRLVFGAGSLRVQGSNSVSRGPAPSNPSPAAPPVLGD